MRNRTRIISGVLLGCALNVLGAQTTTQEQPPVLTQDFKNRIVAAKTTIYALVTDVEKAYPGWTLNLFDGRLIKKTVITHPNALYQPVPPDVPNKAKQ